MLKKTFQLKFFSAKALLLTTRKNSVYALLEKWFKNLEAFFSTRLIILLEIIKGSFSFIAR